MRQEALDKVTEIRKWIDEQVGKQSDVSLDEDPVFRISDIDMKITRANGHLNRLTSIPKPKEKKKKLPKNFKIDNMTFNGKDGENLNLEDFIKYDNGDSDDEEIPQKQQQQEKTQNEKTSDSNTSNDAGEDKSADHEEKAESGSSSSGSSEDL